MIVVIILVMEGFRATVMLIPAFLCLHPYTFRFVPSSMPTLGGLLHKASSWDSVDSYAPSSIAVFASLYFLLCSLVHVAAWRTSDKAILGQ